MIIRSDLAAIASATGIPYAIVHQRWSEGLRGKDLRAPYIKGQRGQDQPARRRETQATRRARVAKRRALAASLGISEAGLLLRIQKGHPIDTPHMRPARVLDGRTFTEWADYALEHNPSLDRQKLVNRLYTIFAPSRAAERAGETERASLRKFCERRGVPYPHDEPVAP